MLVEPEIAPLAKRLAEENNVNWRALTGSGTNGRILERDVLEYLARVMAGEEDMNPTAEPLPEGLDAWPEDDVKSYYGVDTSSSSESSSYSPDLDDESLFVDAAEPVSSLRGSQETLDEDIFLVDEEDLSVATVATHEPLMYDTSLDSLDDDISDVYGALTLDDIGLDDAGETLDLEMDHFADGLEAPATVDALEDSSLESLDAFVEQDTVDLNYGDASIEQTGIEETSAEFDAVDTASLFSDEIQPDVEDAFTAIASESSDNSFSDDSFTDIYSPIADTDTENTLSEFSDESSVSEHLAYTDSAFTDEVSVNQDLLASVADDQLFEEAFTQDLPIEASQAPSFEFQETQAFTSSSETPVETQSWQSDAAISAEHEVATEQWSEAEAEPAYEPEPTYEPEPVQPVFAPVATMAAGVALGGLAQGLGFEDRSSSALEHSAQGLSAHTLPLVTYGILLRRHVDLSTLIQAQHAVAEELGHEEPLAITSFLLRAAAKALHKVPLVQGVVGLASIREQGVGITAIPEASSAPFRTILAQSQQVMHGALTHDQVVLAVADMSGFDIDEAVLNVGVPVLTLGRMMYDNSKGTHHSTLSISGSVSVESGTKFLSAVAELLNSPVRLVV
jgi:e3 binding domain